MESARRIIIEANRNEEIAKAAANEWCRCYKCDGIVRNLISENSPYITFECNKDEYATCLKWRDSYRASLIALNMKENNNN